MASKVDKIHNNIDKAVKLIEDSEHLVAYTGAGISVESGVPPFRGEGGIWEKYDPKLFDISYFLNNPKISWKLLKEIFFELFGIVKPNPAHILLSKLERAGKLKAIITQNIDNLHQEAGSSDDLVIEFHGNSKNFICMDCNTYHILEEVINQDTPPICKQCKGLLKPDFVFFGEPIPQDAYMRAVNEAEMADVMLVIGSTGIVFPAAGMPVVAKNNNATIIEINIQPSQFTDTITDIFLQGKAGDISRIIAERLGFQLK